MESVTFNGIVLTDTWPVIARRGLAYRNAVYEPVPGRDGVLVTGSEMEMPQVSLVFAMGQHQDGGGMDEIRQLMHILDVKEPKKLELGDDGGLYYMALPSGERAWIRTPSSGMVEVPFLVVDAAMYGEQRTATVPSGGSVTFTVGGTYNTKPTLLATSAVRDSSSGQWGVRLDAGKVLRFAFSSNTSRRVEVDCGARTAKVASSAALPTLDSDWFEFSPGSHTVQMDLGTGAATLTWIERWM